MSQEKVQTVEEVNDILREITEPEIVESDSKNRCQHSRTVNQCKFSVVEGQQWCKYHLALHDAKYRNQNKLKRYRLVSHYSRVSEICGLDDFKSLREEIGMLSVLLEQVWNQCHTPFDFTMNQHRIESIIEKITKCQLMNHKLEANLGQVLDRQTLAVFVDEIIKIISDKVPEPERLKEIGEGIATAMERAKNLAAATATNKELEK